jgi:hypothetical protein
VLAARCEFEAGSGHEVSHRAGDQYFMGQGESGYSGADVHGDTGEVVAPCFAFAGVDTDAQAQAERS